MIVEGYLEELKGTSKSLFELIEKDNMSIISAQSYYKHIPIRGKHQCWTEEIYALADICHKRLYDYCMKKQYIDSKVSYESYLNNGIFTY